MFPTWLQITFLTQCRNVVECFNERGFPANYLFQVLPWKKGWSDHHSMLVLSTAEGFEWDRAGPAVSCSGQAVRVVPFLWAIRYHRSRGLSIYFPKLLIFAFLYHISPQIIHQTCTFGYRLHVPLIFYSCQVKEAQVKRSICSRNLCSHFTTKFPFVVVMQVWVLIHLFTWWSTFVWYCTFDGISESYSALCFQSHISKGQDHI